MQHESDRSPMKDNSKANAGPSRRREETDAFPGEEEFRAAMPNASKPGRPQGRPAAQRIGFCSVLDLVLQRWHWLVLGTASGAVLLYLAGVQMIKPKFTAGAELLRYEAPGKSDAFKTAPISGDTFAALIRAPELLKSVAEQAIPPMPPQVLEKSIKIDPDPESDIVKVQLASRDPHQAIALLNLYITNAV